MHRWGTCTFPDGLPNPLGDGAEALGVLLAMLHDEAQAEGLADTRTAAPVLIVRESYSMVSFFGGSLGRCTAEWDDDAVVRYAEQEGVVKLLVCQKTGYVSQKPSETIGSRY